MQCRTIGVYPRHPDFISKPPVYPTRTRLLYSSEAQICPYSELSYSGQKLQVFTNEKGGKTLFDASGHYGTFYTIEHNVKVIEIGRVNEPHKERLISALLEILHRSGRQAA
jgi:hypothetical protein